MLRSTQNNYICNKSDELYHFGIKGMKWGVRRYQNEDGSLTAEGADRYLKLRKRRNAGLPRATKEYYEYRNKLRKNKEYANRQLDWNEMVNILDKGREFEESKDHTSSKDAQRFRELTEQVGRFLQDTIDRSYASVPKNYARAEEYVMAMLNDTVASLNFEQREIEVQDVGRTLTYHIDPDSGSFRIEVHYRD